MSGGIGIDIGNPMAIKALMSDPSKLAKLLAQSHGESDDSPAGIFADVINIMRADQMRIAEEAGVDLDLQRMTPIRAGELLAGTISGDGVDLVEMFAIEEDNRDEILREMLDEDEYEDFTARKRAMMFTTPSEE